MSNMFEQNEDGLFTVIKPAPRKEPAKAWRNKWRALETAPYGCGCTHAEGDVFFTPYCKGHTSWPFFESKEIAEQRAIEGNAEDLAGGWLGDDYLGAFPVDAA